MKGAVYGYVRVSTKDQNEARQVIAMNEFGITSDNIYSAANLLVTNPTTFYAVFENRVDTSQPYFSRQFQKSSLFEYLNCVKMYYKIQGI